MGLAGQGRRRHRYASGGAKGWIRSLSPHYLELTRYDYAAASLSIHGQPDDPASDPHEQAYHHVAVSTEDAELSRRRSHRGRTALDAALLGWESQWVIGLRLLKIMGGGPAAYSEMQRMVSEKMAAQLELQTRLTGDLLLGRSNRAAARAVKLYRSKVRSNRRRLSR